MDRHLRNVPRWLRMLVAALTVAVVAALVLWGYWFITGRLVVLPMIGGLFGTLIGMAALRWRQQQALRVTRLPEERHDEVLRAAQKGSAPLDPEIRHAAVQLIEIDLQRLERHRVVTAILAAAFLVTSVAAAVYVSSVFWFGVPVVALVGAFLLAQPALLRRRLKRLETPTVEA